MAINWLPPGVRTRGVEAFRGALKAGEVAYNEGRYVEALKLWRKDAMRRDGDGETEFRIGQLYRSGKGVFMNFAEAVHWYERASRRGHIEAKLDLAKILLSGASDYDATRFRQVRRDPDSPATATLFALIYPRGEKVEADAAKARDLLEEVVAAGNLDAVELLAQLYLGARGGRAQLRSRQTIARTGGRRGPRDRRLRPRRYLFPRPRRRGRPGAGRRSLRKGRGEGPHSRQDRAGDHSL